MCACLCVFLREGVIYVFLDFFGMNGFCSGYSSLLPPDKYKFKSIQPSGASGEEVTELLETAKA